MDRRIRAAIAAVTLAVASFSANAQMQGGFVVGGNVGMSYYNDTNVTDHTNAGAGVRAGYEWRFGDWPEDRFAFGVEAGYVDLGKAHGWEEGSLFKDGVYQGNALGRYSLRASGPTLGGNFRFKFNDHWFVYARGGYMRTQLQVIISAQQDGLNYRGSSNLHADGAYAGAGVGYDFSEHFSLGLGYDGYYASGTYAGNKYNSKVGLLSAMAEYHF